MRILTCILKHLNGKKVLGAKMLTKNVSKRQISWRVAACHPGTLLCLPTTTTQRLERTS